MTREVANELRIPVMISAPSGEAVGLMEFLGRFCAPLEKAPLPPELFALAWAREVFIGTAKVTAEEAQRNALSVLREVRQDRDHPKSWRGPRDWGQSRWPEADAVRLKARTNSPHHPPNLEHRDKFPRAILGLPIVIHFKKEDHQAGDPKDHTISAAVPTEKGEFRRLSRFASPVLVRPVRVWTPEGERYVPVVVITKPTLPDAVSPVLELTDRATKPLDSRDVVRTFAISKDEAKILLKLETQLIDSGYLRLFTA